MYGLIRPWLFRADPEDAHGMSLKALDMVGRSTPLMGLVRGIFGTGTQRPVEAFGLRFPNPIGLAAGYDKDAQGWRGLSCLGFGHVEIGTVTPRPQAGNPRPRIFRLEEDSGIINRMGFPSGGADAVERRLSRERPYGMILGVNLGKNKDTPLEEAADDYTALLRRFASLADYLVVNISSPNTPGLRRLQHRDALEALLSQLVEARAAEVTRLGRAVPLLVKLSPDLSDDQLDDALTAIMGCGLDGVIATNTTLSREGLRSANAGETGGLSGAPLTMRSHATIRAISDRTKGRLPIVGVGGIMTADDAQARLDAGATLIQVYTGLIYQGPGIVRKLLRA